LADVLRLHRRVCVLRASGKTADAARLERTELAEAWAAQRASGGTTDVAPLLAAEEARVAEAVILAEMLAPLLASRLAAQEQEAASQSTRVAKTSRAQRETPTPAAPAPTIADFIEGMLAQDRAPSR
jgi:hypothetical protein